MRTIINLFAQPIGSLLAFIYTFVNNYGISIILLTLLVRLLMIPLYTKQIKSMQASAELQPKIKEIQTRYAADKQKMNEKMQELYRKENINPMGGCLPMLVQMPIIMGLFALLRDPLTFMTQPEMLVAVHESFLWVADLSQPDNWILPLLAGLSTYFSSDLSSSMNTDPGAANMMSGMKYFFPVMIFLMGRSFPAGLALYWAVGNALMIVQTFYFNRKRERERLRAELEKEIREQVGANR